MAVFYRGGAGDRGHVVGLFVKEDQSVVAVLNHLKALEHLPALLIEAVVGFSGTATPQFFPDQVHQACLDWCGDLERYFLERLDAAEVLVDVPAERSLLIVPGGPQAGVNGKGLPFYFASQLALLPTELERVAPRFGQMLGKLENNGQRELSRAYLERTMALTVWVLMRLSIDVNMEKSREVIDHVSDTGVDVIWSQRPTVGLAQNVRTFGLVANAKAAGELVPKRRVTVETSALRH